VLVGPGAASDAQIRRELGEEEHARAQERALTSPITDPNQEAGCTSAIYGHAVEVTIYGESCSAWDRRESSSGQFWRTVQGPREEPLVCSMSKGGPLYEVRDSGEAMYGSRICAALTAEGWSESPGPGVEREEQQRREAAAAKVQREGREAVEVKQTEEAFARERAQNARKAEAEARKVAAEARHEEAETHKQTEREQHRADEETKRAEREAGG
jgi:hypothetical protein